jgi:glycosyltransferase involved in cell wall biosynthesis
MTPAVAYPSWPGPHRVVVAHAGRQHSHQLALALDEAGMLAGYWTGIPTRRLGATWVPDRLWRRLVRYAPVSLPAGTVRHYPVLPALVQTVGRVTGPAGAAVARRRGEQAFDRWAAGRLRAQAGVRAVVAYENSARLTFREARQRGLVTILDAASVHHTEQDRLNGYAESPALHRRITADKDAEIALADYILCVSEVARASYVEGGVPAGKLGVITLGADVETFTPPDKRDRRGGHVFGFVGGFDHRKGGDVLVEAFTYVQRETPCARLVVIGRVAGEFASALRQPGVTLTGQLPQTEVARALQGVDTLVLPSRHESFGMAVIEAMACGVPVIVSDRVGAKDIVEEGINGWVVPVNDAGALATAMSRAVVALRERPKMRDAARQTAEQNRWDSYRERVARQISAWVEAK